MAATRPALGAHDLGGKPRHPSVGGISRHVDETLMTARIDKASGDEMMHAKMPHIAERHRFGSGLRSRRFGHAGSLSALSGAHHIFS